MQYESKTTTSGDPVTFIWRTIFNMKGDKVAFVEFSIDEVTPPNLRDRVAILIESLLDIPYTFGNGMTESEFEAALRKRCKDHNCTLLYPS